MEAKNLNPAELEGRRTAMMGIVGLWADRTDLPDTETYIRNLRGGTRLARLMAQWRTDEPDRGEDRYSLFPSCGVSRGCSCPNWPGKLACRSLGWHVDGGNCSHAAIARVLLLVAVSSGRTLRKPIRGWRF